MTKIYLAVGLIVVCLGLAWGCNKQQDKPSERPSQNPELGENAQPKKDNTPQADPQNDSATQTITIGEDEDDEQISYGADVKLPVGWPEFLVIYKDAKLINAQRLALPTGPYRSIGLATQDECELPMEFYEKLLFSKGYKLVEAIDVEGFLKHEYASPNRGVEIQCTKEEMRTMVYVNTWEVSSE